MSSATRRTLPLFPTQVFAYDLEPARALQLNTALAAAIERCFTPPPRVAPGQNYQTHHDLWDQPDFAALQPVVTGAVERTLAKLEAVHRGWHVTGCWANMNPSGVPHAPHNHPNNLLAGVYYVRTAPGADVITFHDPRPQLYPVWPRKTKATPLNASYWNVPVTAGRAIVFPAWFTHSVPANESSVARISISFNVMLDDAAAVLPPLAWRDLGGA